MEKLEKNDLLPSRLLNKPLKIDGLQLLAEIPAETVKTSFFDPQYRGLLDKQKYGNEGKSREKRRVQLKQMSEQTIVEFIKGIDKTLTLSGHLFLWIDKFHLCQGVSGWLDKTRLQMVDLIVWEKPKIGMGYRTRNKCEFLLVLQKKPIRAKGVWKLHNIPNVWKEGVDTRRHPHAKPLELQKKLIEATTEEESVVLDPAMGSGSVFTACQHLQDEKKWTLNFIGTDIDGENP